MGLNSPLQQNMQNAGLTGIDQLAGNAMYPQSYMDKTQYAVPSQMPTSAEVMRSDYDTPTQPYTGMQPQGMAEGGIAALRYDGEDGSQVQAPVYSNDDKGNLVDSSGAVVVSAEARKDPYISTVAGDPTEMQALFDLKSQDPKQFYSQVANKLGKQIIEKYQGNDNYDNEYTQLQSLKDIAPADYYKNQLGFKAHSMGWQVGQNRGERNAPTQQEIANMIPEAQKAGLAPEEINSLINTNFGQARNQNVRRIATLAANGGSGFNFQKDLQPMLIGVGGAALGAGAFGPLMAAGAEGLGALGAVTEAGAAGAEIAGGAGAAGEAGITGLTGAADAAATTADVANSLPSLKDVYQGYKLANNLYGVAQSGGRNIGADINAARGIYSAAAPMMAAQGGLMNGDGEVDNPMGEAIPSNVGSLYDVYKNLVPVQIRTFAETLGGERSPITEKNFTEKELEQIKAAIGASRDRQTGRSWIQEKEGQPLKQYYDKSVGYDDYGQKKGRFDDLSISPNSAIRNTLGRFSYHKDPEGNLIATDSYDFYNDLPKRTRPTSDYENMSILEKIGTLAGDTFTQKGGIATLPSRIGNAFIGRDGRPVVANLGPANFASGGISSLGSYSDGGHLLKGPGDGMSDDIPAKIGNRQPARLADGEFVIPADVVSHLGNGSTDAGAKHLYKMMDRIRRARTGNPKQGKKINPDKYLPRE